MNKSVHNSDRVSSLPRPPAAFHVFSPIDDRTNGDDYTYEAAMGRVVNRLRDRDLFDEVNDLLPECFKPVLTDVDVSGS